MGLISGSAACTRFNVVSLPEQVDFELIPFRPIMPGSTVREREGFVPFEPGETFEIGAKRWAFRIRIDKVVPDATAVSERVKELVKVETESVGPPNSKVRQELKRIAEDEIMQHPMPRSKVIECVLEETLLYVGSVSKTHLGLVCELLKRIGVEVEFKTPWLDAGQEDIMNDLIEIKEPGQSLWGCHFLKKLINDKDTFVEPEKGGVRMITQESVKASLTGPVINEVDRFLEMSAELTNAKLITDGFIFNLDGLSFRFSGLKLEKLKNRHWTEQLEIRLEKIKILWEWLDSKYQLLMMSDQKS